MLSANRDALICDLAETYGIYDYRALPASMLATLAVGLREESRIKMHMIGAKATRHDMFLAAAVDRLTMLLWMMTTDGKNGTNKPKSMLNIILGESTAEEEKVESFETGADFDDEWQRITGVKNGG